MDHAEKLAIATRLMELTMPPAAAGILRDKPRPPPEVLARLEEMTNRRRALMAQLYAERLSDEQLRGLEAYHNSELARSTAAVMPEIVAEMQRRLAELWGNGEPNVLGGNTPRNRAFSSSSAAIVSLQMTTGDAPLEAPQEAAVKRRVAEDRMIETTHTHLIRSYLQAVEAGASGGALSRFYTPDAEQIEHPNRLNPKGGRSDLATLLARAEKGKHLLGKQTYEVVSLVATGHTVATEVLWSGTLAIPLGTLAAGATMRAHIAMFFDMKNGLIHRQRNYDCFDAS